LNTHGAATVTGAPLATLVNEPVEPGVVPMLNQLIASVTVVRLAAFNVTEPLKVIAPVMGPLAWMFCAMLSQKAVAPVMMMDIFFMYLDPLIFCCIYADPQKNTSTS
jgi:hypothetical protein